MHADISSLFFLFNCCSKRWYVTWRTISNSKFRTHSHCIILSAAIKASSHPIITLRSDWSPTDISRTDQNEISSIPLIRKRYTDVCSSINDWVTIIFCLALWIALIGSLWSANNIHIHQYFGIVNEKNFFTGMYSKYCVYVWVQQWSNSTHYVYDYLVIDFLTLSFS